MKNHRNISWHFGPNHCGKPTMNGSAAARNVGRNCSSMTYATSEHCP